MKILYIIPRFQPFRGGAEQNIEAMATKMAAIGHDVTVYTTNIKFRNEKLQWKEQYKGIKIIRHWAINKALYAGFYPMLLPRLLTSRFDVIHVSGFGFAWTEFCLILKKITSPGTKMINTPHGPFMAFADKGFRLFIKKFYTFFLKLFLNRLYSKVIAVVPPQSEWMTREYNISPNKIELIPNGIYESYIEKKLPHYDPEDRIVITYLNRMEWYKGIQDVLYAIHKLKPEVKDRIIFWIMGREGSYTKKIKEIINETDLEYYTRIIYTPTDEERDEAFLTSQINILPSRWEATGLVLIEAMAKGNVIITTNQNEAVDMLINIYSGYSYNFGDVDRLSDILEDLVKYHDRRRIMIEHNHKFVRNFTWEAVFPKYLDLINQLHEN